MGKLATSWKSAKDDAEKLCKGLQKAGKKADFPKFKSAFQDQLDTFESSFDTIEKLKKKLEEEQKTLATEAQKCKTLCTEYDNAIKANDKSFDGPTSRDAVNGKMQAALKKIESEIDKMLK